jgi:hypothetical protein
MEREGCVVRWIDGNLSQRLDPPNLCLPGKFWRCSFEELEGEFARLLFDWQVIVDLGIVDMQDAIEPALSHVDDCAECSPPRPLLIPDARSKRSSSNPAHPGQPLDGYEIRSPSVSQ